MSRQQATVAGGPIVQDRTILYDRIVNITERNTTLGGLVGVGGGLVPVEVLYQVACFTYELGIPDWLTLNPFGGPSEECACPVYIDPEDR